MKNNPYALNVSRYSTHSIITKNIGKNKRVLDVGCNDGYIGKISDTSNVFYGLDYLEESVAKSKESYKDAVMYDLNDLHVLPWEGKFDVIIFADVLEHVLFPEQVLRFFVDNYLAANGRIIISLPNVANWQVRLKLLSGNFDYADTGILDRTHLHLYTFKSAEKLVKSAELRVKRKLGGASFFGPLISLIPLLSPLLATNIVFVNEKE